MARDEQDREDLLREATALAERAELSLPEFAESVVVGFRAGGAASVFFGADPVFQFNAAGELRRGFQDGRLIKAVGGRLYEMRRQRRAKEVQLLRREFTDEEAAGYLEDCRRQLDRLRERLAGGDFELIGQVPAGKDVVARIIEWLDSLPREIAIAGKPNVA